MGKLPFFKRGDYYYDVLKGKVYHLSEGGEPVYATYSFSSIGAAAESAWVRMDTNATDLETDKEDLFFQWFMSILRAGLIYRQYPIGEQTNTTDKLVPNTAIGQQVGFLDNKMSPYDDPHEDTEFWIIKGTTIGFKFFNNQSFAFVQKLKYTGKKYKQEEVKVGELHKGKTLSQADMDTIMQTARPIYMRRIV